jgi:hypothetical protein
MVMDAKYRLVFRGEVLDGQHRAVVKRRLKAALDLTEPQLETLFSGNAVVVKKGVDAAATARYKNLFRDAGARLRVARTGEPQAGNGGAADVSSGAGEEAEGAADADPDPEGAFSVVLDYRPPPSAPAPEIDAPDFVVANVGVNLVDAGAVPVSGVREVFFELLEHGVDLLDRSSVDTNEPEVPIVDFELADVGADIGVGIDAGQMHAVPDISHQELVAVS